MPQFGTFITKEGKEVRSKQSISDYILNSDYNTLKIYKKIAGNIDVPLDGTGTADFVHGLRYVPAHLTYYRLKKTSGSFWLDHTAMNNTIPDNDDYDCETYVNSEKLLYRSSDNASRGATTIEYRSFLMVDPVSLVSPSVTGVPLTEGVGFKVSKPGVEVRTAKAHELLISSKYEALKFHQEIPFSFSMTAAQTSKEISFTHGLPYIPMFLGVIQDGFDTTKEQYMPFGRVPQALSISSRISKGTVTLAGVSIGFDVTVNGRLIILKNMLAAA